MLINFLLNDIQRNVNPRKVLTEIRGQITAKKNYGHRLPIRRYVIVFLFLGH